MRLLKPILKQPGCRAHGPTPTFRVTVVSRSVQAVNYKHRSGATKMDFAGTDLMPAANGQAKVESKKGYIEIEVEFGNLQKPTTFGNEYLTYILWAISPEGRAVNLGEVLVGDNHRSKLDVTTDLQAFALVVTAEPYYAVRQPSNVVVIENVVREDTKGTTEAVNAKYELLERGGYIPTGYKFDPVVLNAKLPLEFFEARNALRIAQSEGAENYASDSYQHAVQLMNKADEYATSKHIDRKPLIAVCPRGSADCGRCPRDHGQENGRRTSGQRTPGCRQCTGTNQAQADDATRQKEQAESEQRKLKRPKLRRNLTQRMRKPPRLRQNLMRQRPGNDAAMHRPQQRRPNPIWRTAKLHRQLRFPPRRRMRNNPA